MKRVLMVVPPYNEEILMPELGVPRLVAYLRSIDVEVGQIDLNSIFIHQFIPRLRYAKNKTVIEEMKRLVVENHTFENYHQALDDTPKLFDSFYRAIFSKNEITSVDIMGISLLGTPQLFPALVLAKIVKQIAPKIKIVIGGSWATEAQQILPKVLTDFPQIDGAIIGAGENPLRVLADTDDWDEVPNLVWRYGDDVHRNPMGPNVSLADIPGPDFSDLNLDLYPIQVLPIATCTGCYWGRCLFCRHISETGVEFERSAKQVVDYVEKLIHDTGIRRFHLAENATYPKMMRAFADELLVRSVDISWSAMVRIEAVQTEEDALVLARSGLKYLFTGMESIVESDLKFLKKGITARMVEHLLVHCKTAGIGVNLFTLDVPSLNPEHFKITLDWLVDHHELVNHAIVQRFCLSMNSETYSNPDLLSFKIESGDDNNLDVFNLDFKVDSKFKNATDKETHFKMVDEFRERFYANRAEGAGELDFWEELKSM